MHVCVVCIYTYICYVVLSSNICMHSDVPFYLNYLREKSFLSCSDRKILPLLMTSQ